MRPPAHEKPSIAPAPKSCPVCRSAHVSTSNKAQRSDAYWRCDQCGHIWNPARIFLVRRSFL